MGSWFVQYFLQSEERVYAYDTNRVQAFPAPGVLVSSSVKECVRGADYVFICTPTHQMPAAIREASVHMKDGAVVVEISSIKRDVFPALRRVKSTIIPVSLHPMFGPNAGNKAPRMLIIPVRDTDLELGAIVKLINDAIIYTIRTPRLHDRVMGFVLGLTYFINLALVRTIPKHEVQLFKEAAGSTFSVQMTLAESVIGEDPNLIETLISGNPETLTWIEAYLKSANKLSKLSRNKGQIKRTATDLSSSLQKNSDLKRSNEILYRIISFIKENK